MSFGEELKSILTTWTSQTFTSWDTLVDIWLDENATTAQLSDAAWTAWQGQFIGNYDAWIRFLTLGRGLPMVVITGQEGHMNNELGTAVVAPRLSSAVALDVTPLDPFGAGSPIAPANLDATRIAFGKIQVRSNTNALGPAGTYRGMVRYQDTGMTSFRPLAWVVVVISP